MRRGCPAGPEPKCYLGEDAWKLIEESRVAALNEAAALCRAMMASFDMDDSASCSFGGEGLPASMAAEKLAEMIEDLARK